MSEIAKCPLCGKDPEVWCRDEEIRIRIVCCKHATYSTPGWNQYSAAMELAKAEVAASNAAFNVQLERLKAAIEASEDMLFQARMRVLEVFK